MAPQLAFVAEKYLAEPEQIVISGKPQGEAYSQIVREIRKHYRPHIVLIYKIPQDDWLEAENPFLKNLEGTSEPKVYFCRNYTCELPTSDLTKIRDWFTAK